MRIFEIVKAYTVVKVLNKFTKKDKPAEPKEHTGGAALIELIGAIFSLAFWAVFCIGIIILLIKIF